MPARSSADRCISGPVEVPAPQIWAGVDIGKEHHHCVVIGPNGDRLLSRRVANDEPELLTLLIGAALVSYLESEG